jgi:hypothetical protein
MRQLVVSHPRLIMLAELAFVRAFKHQHDFRDRQRPEPLVMQASGAPLAQQFIDRVYCFAGAFFAGPAPFPDASAAAFG